MNGYSNACRGFNPRARMGRDHPSARHRQLHAVSIHAPAWGATQDAMAHCTPEMFQSTRPHGARPEQPFCEVCARKFQSTRPHGARRTPAWISVHHQGFNPRARMGRDTNYMSGKFAKYVSIHAPAWGATVSLFPLYSVFKFQSTRPHGARHPFPILAP